MKRNRRLLSLFLVCIMAGLLILPLGGTPAYADNMTRYQAWAKDTLLDSYVLAGVPICCVTDTETKVTGRWIRHWEWDSPESNWTCCGTFVEGGNDSYCYYSIWRHHQNEECTGYYTDGNVGYQDFVVRGAYWYLNSGDPYCAVRMDCPDPEEHYQSYANVGGTSDSLPWWYAQCWNYGTIPEYAEYECTAGLTEVTPL
jgi:hypothetical protein